jgi:hypothetical protein
LAVTIRYKAYGVKEEEIRAKLTASWLGFVLCFKAVYDSGGLSYRLRLFGGTIKSNEESSKNAENLVEDKTASEDEFDSGTDFDLDSKNVTDDEIALNNEFSDEDFSKEGTRDEKNKSRVNFRRKSKTEESGEEFFNDESEFQPKKTGIITKIGKILDGIVNKLISKVKAISEKWSALKRKKDAYTKLWNNKRTKEAVKYMKAQLIILLKHIKPRRWKGKLTYGTGDPATCGQHLGYMSILFPVYGDNFDITPNFNEKICEGDIFMKGRIRLWTVGICILKVLLNKNCKITIDRFKRIREQG